MPVKSQVQITINANDVELYEKCLLVCLHCFLSQLFHSIEQNFAHQSKTAMQYAPIRIKDSFKQIKMLVFDWCIAADINILRVQN